MKYKMTPLKACHEITKGKTTFAFLEGGDIFYAVSNGCMINGLRGNPMDGSVNNIWLRIYKGKSLKVIPMVGLKSTSLVSFSEGSVIYTGKEDGVSWNVTFTLIDDSRWTWHVKLSGSGESCDLLYGQDIGVADEGGVLTNELYMAQYLGHSIFETENGYTVCSRQNQQSGCGNPYLQQGMCIGKAVHYSTDGTQFFGLESKVGNTPLSGNLADINYQYELSYTGLQSEKITLDGTVEVAFYGVFIPDCKDAVRKPLEDTQFIKSTLSAQTDNNGSTKAQRPIIGESIVSKSLLEKEIDKLFPKRRLEEKDGEQLLSFFCGNHSHVVLREKEVKCERPHAVIHTNPVNTEEIDSNVLASTSHMCGVFMSQLVVGNTSFHKLISVVRNPLNLLHNSGLRLYIKQDGKYCLLTMPSAFEMGMSYSRWYYFIDGDLLRITAFVSADSPAVTLETESTEGKSYDLLFTAQLLFGEHEFSGTVELENKDGVLTIDGEKPDSVSTYSEKLCYKITPSQNWDISDDRVFFGDNNPRNGTLLTMSVSGASRFAFTLEGCLSGEAALTEIPSFTDEKQKCEEAFQNLTCGLKLILKGSEEAEKLNETIWWYTHNAMIHFASPHGIEQPGGAAWGTRDICQGPIEHLLAFGNFKLARAVLCRIFSHQFLENKEWPQWFMFDNYPYSAGECHGDVVFWPLKALGDYLIRSKDLTILEEILPYVNFETNLESGKSDSLLSHVEAAVKMVEETRFVGDTHLVSYAGGDWDDTLQPADPAMKEKLISAWTVALCFQSFTTLSKALSDVSPAFSVHLKSLACAMQKDFMKHLVKDGVTAGFGVYENGSIRVMIHPGDDSCGVHYRLLPLTRSIIGGMVDKDRAAFNMKIIDEHLKCPDGVRLMDHPVDYDGGVSHTFMRAEQAANVGREISLQYTHAHIRYIEACARMGLSDYAWDSLFNVNPIKITEVVPNALTRQSNLYFSSSEGCFNDRYIYSRDFNKLRDGSVNVKGGWRLYSSGPGIYLNQLITNVLGIRIMSNGIELCPAMPMKTDGMKAEINLFGKKTTLIYHPDSSQMRVEKGGKIISSPPLNDVYGQRGCLVSAENLGGSIDIYL